MKESLLLIFSALLVSYLAYTYSLFGFLLVAVLALSFTLILITILINYLRKAQSSRLNHTLYGLVGVCTFGLVIHLLRPYDQAILVTDDVSKALAYAYKTDQADRMTVKTYLKLNRDQITKRDSLRLAQAQQFYSSQKILHPIDKFHAAFILHHGKGSDVYRVAHALAKEAASTSEMKDNLQAQWLAKASYDRWMLALGKPEKYGTQNSFSLSVK